MIFNNLVSKIKDDKRLVWAEPCKYKTNVLITQGESAFSSWGSIISLRARSPPLNPGNFPASEKSKKPDIRRRGLRKKPVRAQSKWQILWLAPGGEVS